MGRVRVDGKHFVLDGRRFHFRGLSYGTFQPRADEARFPERDGLKRDLAAMERLRIAFNPENRLSPCKMLPTAGACGMEQTHPGRRAAL